jgi:hypothetical protein
VSRAKPPQLASPVRPHLHVIVVDWSANDDKVGHRHQRGSDAASPGNKMPTEWNNTQMAQPGAGWPIIICSPLAKLLIVPNSWAGFFSTVSSNCQPKLRLCQEATETSESQPWRRLGVRYGGFTTNSGSPRCMLLDEMDTVLSSPGHVACSHMAPTLYFLVREPPPHLPRLCRVELTFDYAGTDLSS